MNAVDILHATLESVSSVRGVLWENSAQDHLPESVAGAAVFDPLPRVGSAVGSKEVQLRCHPMVHEGRCKHPALHLRYHLQVRLNTAPGRPAQYTVPAAVIQAVCIATPGSARINVAYRLYSADELY